MMKFIKIGIFKKTFFRKKFRQKNKKNKKFINYY